MQKNKSRIKALLVWGFTSLISCSSIYLLCNFLASIQINHFPLYFDFELTIPFIPWMIYCYISLVLLLLLNVFLLKDPKVIKVFSICLIITVLIAGLFFVLFPGKLGFNRVSDVAGYEGLFSLLHFIDQPFNLFPSLHITYSCLTVFAIVDQTTNKIFHYFLIIWLILIGFSVVLVHQHHLFDIFSGFILAWLVAKIVYRRYIPKKKVA